jgi:hypothetical protein
MIVEPHDLFITCREVGRMLGLCRQSVLKVVEANGIRTRKIKGIKGARFYRPDVERVLAAADVAAEVSTATRA